MAADVKQKRAESKRTVERGVTNTMLEYRNGARREQNHICLKMFRHFIPGKHELLSGSFLRR